MGDDQINLLHISLSQIDIIRGSIILQIAFIFLICSDIKFCSNYIVWERSCVSSFALYRVSACTPNAAESQFVYMQNYNVQGQNEIAYCPYKKKNINNSKLLKVAQGTLKGNSRCVIIAASCPWQINNLTGCHVVVPVDPFQLGGFSISVACCNSPTHSPCLCTCLAFAVAQRNVQKQFLVLCNIIEP